MRRKQNEREEKLLKAFIFPLHVLVVCVAVSCNKTQMEQKTFLLHTNYEIFFHLTFLALKYDPTLLQHFQIAQRMGFE